MDAHIVCIRASLQATEARRYCNGKDQKVNLEKQEQATHSRGTIERRREISEAKVNGKQRCLLKSMC